MIKHFGGHTDVCFAKSLRTDADHNGKSQHRLNTHNGHFGMRSVNKTITIGDMEVSEGDIIFADTDGVCKVPATHAEEVVAVAGEIRRW